jgi:CheY-like chemotaxis protein
MDRNRPGGKHVLLIDDDPLTRAALSLVLDADGFSVAEAADGGEALGLLLDGGPAPDLIVLDLIMPGMDGLAFRRRQLQEPRLASIPVVVFSAAADAALRAADLGVAACLQKPLDPDVLLDAVRRYCS